MTVSETVEGRERYPINVRYAREFRDDPAMLGQILIATTQGAQIPLAEVADIQTVTGPPMIRSEDGKLVGFVSIDTDRPIADYVADARVAVVATPARAGHAGRVGRPVHVLRAREGEAEARRAGDPRDRVPAAVPQHALAGRDRHRAARGPVLARRGSVDPVPARLQHQRRGVGRRHRARRARRRDRGRDAALPHARPRPAQRRGPAPDRGPICARRSSRAPRTGSARS